MLMAWGRLASCPTVSSTMDAASITEVLSTLMGRRELSAGQMRTAMEALLTGKLGEAESAAFLIALRMKGESALEIAGAAATLREHMVRWDPGRTGVLDTCGTGGDGAGTFNISTATAFVASAAGVPVVKHGNRSVSSRSGSADLLSALGLAVDGDAAFARRCLDTAGLAFCFAPLYHPAMKSLATVRGRLGVGTIFNCLGPLLNPAGAEFQLLGVGRLEWLEPMAGALALLGTRHALLVNSCDGLDEVSLSSATRVREVRDGVVRAAEWTPRDLGLEPCMLSELCASGPEQSAALVCDVLHGKPGPALRVVLANAAAALLAAERAASLSEGVEMARAAISSGRAREVVEKLRSLGSQRSAFSSQPSLTAES